VNREQRKAVGGALRRRMAAHSAQRRNDVVRAAYHLLAEKGFEGLRMRGIAERAGMDHATLHYYFKGKEALIHGVLDYIIQELSIGRSSAIEVRGLGPQERLAAHFDELVRQVRERPEMFLVLAEINARSMRDLKVHSVVAKNDRRWKRFLMQIVKEGIQKQELHSGLGPEVAVDAIIAIIRGLSVTYARRPEAMERTLRQLRIWLEAK
jgi:AcrR family transcriptional regulator